MGGRHQRAERAGTIQPTGHTDATEKARCVSAGASTIGAGKSGSDIRKTLGGTPLVGRATPSMRR